MAQWSVVHPNPSSCPWCSLSFLLPRSTIYGVSPCLPHPHTPLSVAHTGSAFPCLAFLELWTCFVGIVLPECSLAVYGCMDESMVQPSLLPKVSACMVGWLVPLAWLPECHPRSAPLWEASLLVGIEGVMQASPPPSFLYYTFFRSCCHFLRRLILSVCFSSINTSCSSTMHCGMYICFHSFTRKYRGHTS